MARRRSDFRGIGTLSAPLLGLVALALTLAGCGLFGDDDAVATPDDSAIEVASSIRVEAGERWFDIDPSSVDSSSLGGLTANVENLGADISPAVDAGIVFGDSEFVIVPSVDGSEPDVEALAVLLSDVSADTDTVVLPYKPVAATLTNETAQEYADELNSRMDGGIEVAISGQKKTLSAQALGPATTVDWRGEDWEVDVDFAQIEAELARLFPDVGAEGGEALFTVEPGETEDDPATVVIVPGPFKTVCCDEASISRIERALTSELEVATLSFANIDGERGTAWAQDLGVTELVGTFTTRYTPGQDRNINIQRIAELTQGVIIEPGESFSLNGFVGERTRAKGFVPAGTIINGHLIDSVGGGISQYATTIFNASFFAGLEFDAYQSHSIYFSRYPYGREATISFPAPALIIHNPTPHGVLIWPTTDERSITVDLYSTKWVDAEQTGQSERAVGVACTRVTTERTRTFLDGKVDVDSVMATYRKEGIACDGTETINPNDPTTTTTTIDPNAPTTSVDPTAPTTIDPTAPSTTSSSTTSSTTTSTTAADTTSSTSSTTTTTTITVAPETTATTDTTVAPDTTEATETP